MREREILLQSFPSEEPLAEDVDEVLATETRKMHRLGADSNAHLRALDFAAADSPCQFFDIILVFLRAAWPCGKQPMRGRNPDKAIMIFA